MCHPDVAHIPDFGRLFVAVDAYAEESQFESETPAFGGFEIAGVIPPLGLKIGMVEVVAGELIVVAGEGDPIGGGCGEEAYEDETGNHRLEPVPQWQVNKDTASFGRGSVGGR